MFEGDALEPAPGEVDLCTMAGTDARLYAHARRGQARELSTRAGLAERRVAQLQAEVEALTEQGAQAADEAAAARQELARLGEVEQRFSELAAEMGCELPPEMEEKKPRKKASARKTSDGGKRPRPRPGAAPPPLSALLDHLINIDAPCSTRGQPRGGPAARQRAGRRPPRVRGRRTSCDRVVPFVAGIYASAGLLVRPSMFL